MKVEIMRTRTIVSLEDAEITGATLLSIDEFKEYKDNIPLLKESWWLRSPGVCVIVKGQRHMRFAI